jgi:molybdopterin-guanine dinucleotide biosynthesis protein A
MKKTHLPISAVILAGGLARRFRGEDKGLIELARRPLTAWVVDRLRDRVAEVLVNANRNLSQYAALGQTVVTDHLPGNPGPLAGVLAAGRTAQQEWLLSVPCDAPFLPLDLAMHLHAQAVANQVRLTRAADETGTHYAVMLVHRSLLADMEDFVRNGGRQVRAWQETQELETVRFETDPYAFLNVNTPDDLRRAERLAPRYHKVNIR